jgi:hypothetical protein
VKSISWRAQLGLVALGYAVVLVVAAALLYGRHLQELLYPVEASGGMWAAGDAFLWIFIACLFMVPTAFLVWVIAKSESIYKTYSQLLLGLSLSAPVSLALFTLGQNYLAQSVWVLCLFRLVWSPFIILGIGVSRLVARFDRAKKLVSYALLVEGLTLATAVVLLIHAWSGPRNH